MRKPTVLIADKNSEFRASLQLRVKNLGHPAVFWECCNGLETLRYIDALQPDLILMTIELPGRNGFEVLDLATNTPPVILFSDSPEHAANAFEYQAIDYLMKPVNEDKLDRAFRKFSSSNINPKGAFYHYAQPTAYPSRILVEKGNRLVGIPVDKITHIKADKDYSWLHTVTGERFLSNYGIGQLEIKLNPQIFLRIHRSYMVNIDHIQELYRDISKLYLALPNGVEVNIGRNYLPIVKELMY